jgi:hypothetical protein
MPNGYAFSVTRQDIKSSAIDTALYGGGAAFCAGLSQIVLNLVIDRERLANHVAGEVAVRLLTLSGGLLMFAAAVYAGFASQPKGLFEAVFGPTPTAADARDYYREARGTAVTAGILLAIAVVRVAASSDAESLAPMLPTATMAYLLQFVIGVYTRASQVVPNPVAAAAPHMPAEVAEGLLPAPARRA